MEEAQYTRGRAETAVGPDAAIMLRHDRTTLSALPPDRWAGALFSINLREALMAPIEMALVAGGFHDPRAAATGETNAWGDHVGHTALLASTSIPILAMVQPTHPDAAQINAGYGTQLIIDFTRWARARGVQVIGGVATGFADSPPPDATTAAIRAVYATGGADFLELPNHSRYPRIAFFDTHEHLNETWQIIHSVALADALVPLLKHHEMRDSLAMAPAPAAHR
jgi:hypothetical protein